MTTATTGVARPPPSRQEAFEAFCTLLAFVTSAPAAAPMVYTADRLPPDCRSRDAFLRRHRDRLKSGAPGWTKVGKVRSVTVQAWSDDVERETAGASAPKPRLSLVEGTPRDIDAELDAALGIRTRAPRTCGNPVARTR